MALHRDIHWIGRQWAVTGYGLQAINQKHGGQFDIDIAHLWDDSRHASLREQKWFNADDFATGLAIARKRFPGAPRPPEPEPEPAPTPPPPPVAKVLQATGIIAPPPPAAPAPPPLPVETLLKVSGVITPSPKAVERATAASADFQMGIPGRARFVRPWRFPPRSS